MAHTTDWKKSVSKDGKNEIQTNVQTRLGSINQSSFIRTQGIAGDPLKEGVPKLIQTNTEKIFEGSNNTSIVLGRDRPSTRLSGYGGAGHTQAGSIDIVAGRWGYQARSFVKDERAYVNPSFTNDAARIYISQKTDIDKNFQLANGSVGNSVAKSGIALKADGVRVIAREGIKLITRTDSTNSQGGPVDAIRGVDLIAGNDDTNLQPQLRGNLTVQAMRELSDQMSKLNGIVDSLLTAQMQLNAELTHHTHYSPFFGKPTSPSPPVVAKGLKTSLDHLQNAKRSLIIHKQNLENYKMRYLCVCSPSDIRSKYHYLN